nr:cadherin-like domain-containing protein [Oscillospiraceae bacterium]
MFRTRSFSLLLALCCVLALAGTAAAAETDCDSVYCFAPEDFSGESDLLGICITDLPDSSTGTLLLGHRVVMAGDILTAEQVAQMTFSPLQTEVDASAQVGYLPIYEDRVAPCASMTIGIRGKEDQPPVAEDSTVETYKNLPNTGKLKVSDPEGQALTFTVTRQPRRGTVTIAEDGSFTYTPKKNKVGVDSFVYTAADPAGKVSREATVTITILKPTEAAQYTDTNGRDCRFAAEWMKHTGIFVGESLAENPCFSPDREVTRGEFVTMLVKTLEIPTEEDLTCAGYTDEIPQWLQPYLAAAMRAGVTAGLAEQETFGADVAITGAEAEAMLRIALDTDTEEVFAQSGEQCVTRGQAAQMLYRAAKIAEEAGETEIV